MSPRNDAVVTIACLYPLAFFQSLVSLDKMLNSTKFMGALYKRRIGLYLAFL